MAKVPDNFFNFSINKKGRHNRVGHQVADVTLTIGEATCDYCMVKLNDGSFLTLYLKNTVCRVVVVFFNTLIKSKEPKINP